LADPTSRTTSPLRRSQRAAAPEAEGSPVEEAAAQPRPATPGVDPFWYKDAVIYELHVKSFVDSDGDGIGDFKGLTQKLDYLQELGVSALWLLPFYPSPQKDDGYDIGLYTDVHPSYGTLDDFREFLAEAHRRGLKVITELVINHTSDQHPWFQRARRAPRGSPERDFYVWADEPTKYAETRIIFKDFEPSNWTWDPVADQYFWHRFFHHQPDLNFDNPVVHDELFRVLDFWLEMGVDGMRLDAIPYLYEREGTNCENLPETHAFLKKLRAHVDRKYAGRMLLAEANQWPEDAARYFGDGDECHMNFHFPIMPRLFMALRMEDRFPILDILEQTPPIPANAQWAIFLRNHDELTLEMVTDEERDYMYRVYAHDQTARINLGIRRRLAPLLENNRRRIEVMNSLLLSLPGTPVLYYGDEIGMGDNFYLGDRHGVRTPMQWSGDRNAGFSRANPQRLFLPAIVDPEYHFESVNVEAQHANPSSLLWWTRRLLALRRRHQAFGRGDFRWVEHGNRRVLVFTRCYEGETILVVANLSRFAQAVELDLRTYEGTVPVELFGHTRFPAIGRLPYLLTLGPHTFFWFRLEPRGGAEAARPGAAPRPEELPLLEVEGPWERVFDERRDALLRRVAAWLPARRWFGGKDKTIRAVDCDAPLPVALPEGGSAYLLVLRVEYVADDPERYLLPLMASLAEVGAHLHHRYPWSPIARLRAQGSELLLHDAVASPAFGHALLALIADGRRALGTASQLVGIRYADAIDRSGALEARPGAAEQSNSSIVFGDRYILKLLRRIEEGENLDRELGLALTRAGFHATADVVGALEIRWGGRRSATCGVLQRFVANQGDAWEFTLEALDRYFERALTAPPGAAVPPTPEGPLVRASAAAIPEAVHRAIGEAYLDAAQLLGQRTAELHLGLAQVEGPDFQPEPFTSLYQRSLYQSMRNLLGQTIEALATAGTRAETGEPLGPGGPSGPAAIVARKAELLARFRALVDRRFEGERIRIHGDYHLGQVLWTGRDFVVIDFEGEPVRPLSERRLRRSPLRDVAGMLRSFHYAMVAGLARARERASGSATEAEALGRWAHFWYRWVSVAFLRGYFERVGEARFLPRDAGERQLLLEIFLLEKAVYELRYELANRPDWARIPIEGILELLGGRAE
jgi:maltose alpha-D-glucosyltransferase/alpha-amylase